jgi:hypothetical protein
VVALTSHANILHSTALDEVIVDKTSVTQRPRFDEFSLFLWFNDGEFRTVKYVVMPLTEYARITRNLLLDVGAALYPCRVCLDFSLQGGGNLLVPL